MFSSETCGLLKFWILSKLYELCKSCDRNPCTCEYVTLLQLFRRDTSSKEVAMFDFVLRKMWLISRKWAIEKMHQITEFI